MTEMAELSEIRVEGERCGPSVHNAYYITHTRYWDTLHIGYWYRLGLARHDSKELFNGPGHRAPPDHPGAENGLGGTAAGKVRLGSSSRYKILSSRALFSETKTYQFLLQKSVSTDIQIICKRCLTCARGVIRFDCLIDPGRSRRERKGDWATSVRCTVMRGAGNKAVSRRGLQVPGTPRDGNGSDAG
jgi:hypothetical protein